MKGKIHKSDKGWVIEYLVTDRTPIGVKSWFEEIELHPDDAATLIELDSIFDNIEARISAYPQVEFQIVENPKMDHQAIKYAKLIKQYN